MIHKTKLKTLVSPSDEKPPDHDKSSTIFGEFQIDGYRFLVISIEHHAIECSLLSGCTCPASFDLPEVSRFWVNGHLCAIVQTHEQSTKSQLDLASVLTDRELQIATLVAMGRPNKQIAHQLRISEWTVSTHLRRIFIKLDVDSRAAMVYRCASLIQKIHQFETAIT